jgi:hypothetical protein
LDLDLQQPVGKTVAVGYQMIDPVRYELSEEALQNFQHCLALLFS